jgi:serine/threonine protein phosphatase PrpC
MHEEPPVTGSAEETAGMSGNHKALFDFEKRPLLEVPFQKPTLDDNDDEHRPFNLPQFRHPGISMWTAAHAANAPSEDRSSSLVNVLLQPLPADFDDSETQFPPPDYTTLIRLNMWSVIDGHGGGAVATYASEVLLPHIAANIARVLHCTIVDRGVCTVNGQLRDANALDLDGLIKNTERSTSSEQRAYRYQSPHERLSSTDDSLETNADAAGESLKEPDMSTEAAAAAPPAIEDELVGTHSSREIAVITQAVTESFLAVDEAWINSIDPVVTHQNSCQSNGRWNAGACALVVFTVQRLEWTSVSEPNIDKHLPSLNQSRRYNSLANRDAARLRLEDFVSRSKNVDQRSTTSSTSSLATEETCNDTFETESETTETEGEDDPLQKVMIGDCVPTSHDANPKASRVDSAIISPPGGCSCHCYRAQDAYLYTAHVGDCRAVMLGSAPPQTIDIGNTDDDHADTTDDESSHHSSDETECLSSSDHEADSSEEEDVDGSEAAARGAHSTPISGTTASFLALPSRVTRKKTSLLRALDDQSSLYVALPPFSVAKPVGKGKEDGEASVSSEFSDDSLDKLPLVHLPSDVRPIDLTTDHSAYNPAEVSAVLRRCNNAPRAISSGVGGGIRRVAGSLAVTRALGDAYLKTPLLSFVPYKSHAPYITGRPEVNCRPLVKDADKVLILATDGVWERANGEDVLRWVRNFYDERVAERERRARMPSLQDFNGSLDGEDLFVPGEAATLNNNEASDRDLFARYDDVDSSSRKRPLNELVRSPSPPLKRRKRRNGGVSYNVADVIVRRVLNKVRRARNISSLQALMTLPQGRARRSKHDDITANVVDLSAFIS